MGKNNITLFGKYLKSLKASPSKIESLVGIPAKNITLLSTNNTRIIYGDEFYKIIIAAHYLSGIPDGYFINAIDSIFPDRVRVKLMDDYKHYSPEGRFFKKYTQQQIEIETKLGYSKNQISKYFNDNKKRVRADDLILFIEGMELNLLETFKEIYGNINLVNIQ